MENNALEVPPMRIIETPRLRLRTLQMSDLDAIDHIIRDEKTMLFTSGVVTGTRTVAEQWLSARCLGSGVFNFLITLKPEAQITDAMPDHEQVTVGILGGYHWPLAGYILSPNHVGKGYATEALQAWLPEFWAHMPPAAAEGGLGFDYVEAVTDGGNVGSHRVLLKSGFTLYERTEGQWPHPTLGMRDTNVYRIARPGTTLAALKESEDEPLVPPVE